MDLSIAKPSPGWSKRLFIFVLERSVQKLFNLNVKFSLSRFEDCNPGGPDVEITLLAFILNVLFLSFYLYVLLRGRSLAFNLLVLVRHWLLVHRFLFNLLYTKFCLPL